MSLLHCFFTYFLATYTEARARLNRATNNTDIDSAVEDKTSRAQRKKKQFETDVESDEESSTSNNVFQRSIQKRKNGKNDSKKTKNQICRASYLQFLAR